MTEGKIDFIDLPWDIKDYLSEYYLAEDLLNVACCSKEYYASFKEFLWRKVFIPWDSLKKQPFLSNDFKENLKWTSSLYLHHSLTFGDFWPSVSVNYYRLMTEHNINSLVKLEINNILTDEGIKIICKNLRKLRYLILHNCIDLSVTGWEQLADLTNLKALSIKNCFIRNSGVEKLTHIKNLEEFHLDIDWDENVYITILAFKQINKIMSLKKLTISCTNELRFTPKSLGWIQILKNLVELSFEQTSLGDGGLSYISSSAMQLNKLNIKGCHKITDSGLIVLRNLISLRELNIQDTTFSETALEEYCKHSGMKEMIHETMILTKIQYFWLKSGKCGQSWHCYCI